MAKKNKFTEVFVNFGAAGILLSLAVVLLVPGSIGGTYFALVLQPLFIFGLWWQEPSTLLSVVSTLIVIATIFVVYGLAGLLLYRVWRLVRSRM